MGLHGNAALLMWCEVPSHMGQEQGEWHSQQHLPERLAIPGFLRGRRGFAQDGDSTKTFMLYELSDIAVLTSAAYLDRLNNPTPWSSNMNQITTRFCRATCRTGASWSSGIGGVVLTIRYNSEEASLSKLHDWSESQVAALKAHKAVCGAHFFVLDQDAIVPTKEHELRGRPDDAADCVIVVEGFDADALHSMREEILPEALFAAEGASRIRSDQYTLAHVL